MSEIDPAAVPSEAMLQIGPAAMTPAIGVTVHAGVSLLLNPEPVNAMTVLGRATLGVSVIWAVGEPRVKVA